MSDTQQQQTFNLDNLHPDYIETTASRTKGQDFYEGGDAVNNALTDTYLIKGANETDAKYARRQRRAVFTPWIEKIVTARQALLFRKPAMRELPARIDPFVADVDAIGTPADVFFQDVAKWAQVHGARWVLVDAPQTPPTGYQSKADEQRAGFRPFFQQIPAGSVIDWDIGDDRKLLWAVIRETYIPTRANPGTTLTTKQRWKVWTRQTWHTYESSSGNESTGIVRGSYAEVASGANRIGAVPLVPFLGIRYSDFAGYPVCRPVFDHVRAIYCKWSEMDWNEHLCGLPIPLAFGPSRPEQIDAWSGMWFKTEPGGAAVDARYLEPSGAGIAAMRQTISDLESQIYEIALAQARKDSAQVEAANSQKEDRLIFSASLKDASRQYESGEQLCWELAARWANDANKCSIRYPRDFDDRTIVSTMLQGLLSMRDSGVITSKTLLQTAIDGELVAVEDPVAELKAAQDEADKRSASATSATLDALNTPNVPEE
jgi:hypothetical protein